MRARSSVSPSASRMIATWGILISGVFPVACQSTAPVTSRPTDTALPLNHLPALSGDYFEFESAAVGRPFHIYVRLPEGPGRDRFFSPAAPATRNDLGLVVTSGSRDIPELRESALEWFREWQEREAAPWELNAVTIEGGTHAADSPNSYRLAMTWLFNRNVY